AAPDLAQLRRVLADQVPGAMLDDHRGWIDRMRTMAGTAVVAGVCILFLGVSPPKIYLIFSPPRGLGANKAGRGGVGVVWVGKTDLSQEISSIIFCFWVCKEGPSAVAQQ